MSSKFNFQIESTHLQTHDIGFPVSSWKSPTKNSAPSLKSPVTSALSKSPTSNLISSSLHRTTASVWGILEKPLGKINPQLQEGAQLNREHHEVQADLHRNAAQQQGAVVDLNQINRLKDVPEYVGNRLLEMSVPVAAVSAAAWASRAVGGPALLGAAPVMYALNVGENLNYQRSTTGDTSLTSASLVALPQTGAQLALGAGFAAFGPKAWVPLGASGGAVTTTGQHVSTLGLKAADSSTGYLDHLLHGAVDGALLSPVFGALSWKSSVMSPTYRTYTDFAKLGGPGKPSAATAPAALPAKTDLVMARGPDGTWAYESSVIPRSNSSTNATQASPRETTSVTTRQPKITSPDSPKPALAAGPSRIALSSANGGLNVAAIQSISSRGPGPYDKQGNLHHPKDPKLPDITTFTNFINPDSNHYLNRAGYYPGINLLESTVSTPDLATYSNGIRAEVSIGNRLIEGHGPDIPEGMTTLLTSGTWDQVIAHPPDAQDGLYFQRKHTHLNGSGPSPDDQAALAQQHIDNQAVVADVRMPIPVVVTEKNGKWVEIEYGSQHEIPLTGVKKIAWPDVVGTGYKAPSVSLRVLPTALPSGQVSQQGIVRISGLSETVDVGRMKSKLKGLADEHNLDALTIELELGNSSHAASRITEALTNEQPFSPALNYDFATGKDVYSERTYDAHGKPVAPDPKTRLLTWQMKFGDIAPSDTFTSFLAKHEIVPLSSNFKIVSAEAQQRAIKLQETHLPTSYARLQDDPTYWAGVDQDSVRVVQRPEESAGASDLPMADAVVSMLKQAQESNTPIRELELVLPDGIKGVNATGLNTQELANAFVLSEIGKTFTQHGIQTRHIYVNSSVDNGKNVVVVAKLPDTLERPIQPQSTTEVTGKENHPDQDFVPRSEEPRNWAGLGYQEPNFTTQKRNGADTLVDESDLSNPQKPLKPAQTQSVTPTIDANNSKALTRWPADDILIKTLGSGPEFWVGRGHPTRETLSDLSRFVEPLLSKQGADRFNLNFSIGNGIGTAIQERGGSALVLSDHEGAPHAITRLEQILKPFFDIGWKMEVNEVPGKFDVAGYQLSFSLDTPKLQAYPTTHRTESTASAFTPLAYLLNAPAQKNPFNYEESKRAFRSRRVGLIEGETIFDNFSAGIFNDSKTNTLRVVLNPESDLNSIGSSLRRLMKTTLVQKPIKYGVGRVEITIPRFSPAYNELIRAENLDQFNQTAFGDGVSFLGTHGWTMTRTEHLAYTNNALVVTLEKNKVNLPAEPTEPTASIQPKSPVETTTSTQTEAKPEPEPFDAGRFAQEALQHPDPRANTSWVIHSRPVGRPYTGKIKTTRQYLDRVFGQSRHFTKVPVKSKGAIRPEESFFTDDNRAVMRVRKAGIPEAVLAQNIHDALVASPKFRKMHSLSLYLTPDSPFYDVVVAAAMPPTYVQLFSLRLNDPHRSLLGGTALGRTFSDWDISSIDHLHGGDLVVVELKPTREARNKLEVNALEKTRVSLDETTRKPSSVPTNIGNSITRERVTPTLDKFSRLDPDTGKVVTVLSRRGFDSTMGLTKMDLNQKWNQKRVAGNNEGRDLKLLIPTRLNNLSHEAVLSRLQLAGDIRKKIVGIWKLDFLVLTKNLTSELVPYYKELLTHPEPTRVREIDQAVSTLLFDTDLGQLMQEAGYNGAILRASSRPEDQGRAMVHFTVSGERVRIQQLVEIMRRRSQNGN